jgi:hypothetical protein
MFIGIDFLDVLLWAVIMGFSVVYLSKNKG